jgi:hypothetical protein
MPGCYAPGVNRIATLAALALAGCRSTVAPSPVRAESGPTSDAAPATSSSPVATTDAGTPSPLYEVAEGWHGGAELGSRFRLCPVDGAVFACGDVAPVILRDEGFLIDPALAAGLPDDHFVFTMTGRWPDATWLLYASANMGNWSFAVYRWKTNRWVRLLDIPQGSTALYAEVVAWRGGAFARVSDFLDPHRTSMVRLEGTGALLSLAPSPPGTNREECQPGPGLIPGVRLISTANGDLYGSGEVCPPALGAMVERWTHDAKPEVIRVPTRGCDAPDATTVAAGVAALGWCGALVDHDTPFVTVFDGNTWAEVDVPHVKGRALGYARDEGGEWLVAGEYGAPDANQLLRRPPGADWQPVTLPPSLFAVAPKAPGATSPLFEANPKYVAPRDVEIAGGDTWVLGSALSDDGLASDATVVLRTRPVDHVLHEP